MPTSTNRLKLFLLRCVPALLLLAFWELAVHNNERLLFFFGSPSKIANYFVSRVADGSLVTDFTTTLGEVVAGFLIGNLVGTALGLALWFSRHVFLIARPYIVALGSAPLITLAPLLIIWFGTGFTAKVLIVAFSTVFVSLFQAYSGASEVDPEYLRLMQSFRATKLQTFRKVVAPAAIVWVMAAFRMNVGFAILGAFLGEFISSSQGLGHLIVVATGLFDISLVLCALFLLIAMALVLNYLVSHAEEPLKHLIVKYLLALISIKQAYRDFLNTPEGATVYRQFKRLLYATDDSLVQWLHTSVFRTLPSARALNVRVCDIGGGDGVRITRILQFLHGKFRNSFRLDFIEQSALYVATFDPIPLGQFCRTKKHHVLFEDVSLPTRSYDLVLLIHSIFALDNGRSTAKVLSLRRQSGDIVIVSNARNSFLGG